MSNVGVHVSADISLDTRCYPFRRPPSTIVTTWGDYAAHGGQMRQELSAV
jgi:hypothetical protein